MDLRTAVIEKPQLQGSPLPPVMTTGWHGRPVLMCPRPACGGRVFIVDVALDEAAAVCMLCGRSLKPEGGADVEPLS
jgi:hypothetical protein